LPQKLIIDADPGIGDALVIALALLDPEFDVVGITPTAGCTSGENSSHNVHAVVGWLDPPKWPRMGWSEGPPSTSVMLGGPDPQVLNGRSGLGDFESPVAEPHHGQAPGSAQVEVTVSQPQVLVHLFRLFVIEREGRRRNSRG